MGLTQDLRFTYASRSQVQDFVQLQFVGAVNLSVQGGHFVFTSIEEPRFTFECVIMSFGIRSDRAGEYFAFLG